MCISAYVYYFMFLYVNEYICARAYKYICEIRVIYIHVYNTCIYIIVYYVYVYMYIILCKRAL